MPIITGTVKVGQTLTADTSDITDVDGLPATFTYQWFRVDSDMETWILGATSKTYTLVAADLGKTIRVTVGFTDNADFPESLSSALTAPVLVAGASGPPQGLAAIPGNGFVTLSWQPPANNGVAPVIGYLIKHGLYDPDSSFLLDLQVLGRATVGRDVRSFKVDGLTAGARYRFLVRALTYRQSEERILGIHARTEATLNNPAEGVPIITGTVKVGQTLTADTSGITDVDGLPPAFTYQWLRVDDGMETGISGATSKTYTPVAADLGKTIRVTVGFTDNADFPESLSSALTAPALAGPPGPPQGLVAVSSDRQLRLTWLPSALNSGPPIRYYEVSYRVAFTQANWSEWHTGFETTDTFYAFTNFRNGSTYEFSVHAVNTGGEKGPAALVRGIPGNHPAQGVPMITGTARVGQTLTADTSGITDGDGLPAIFDYQWFRVDDDAETGISGATSKTYTPVADDVGKTIRVKVGFIDNANFSESLSSALTTTTAAPAVASGPPQGLAAIPGNGFVTLSWQPPANNGGAPVLRYLIEYGLDEPGSPLVGAVVVVVGHEARSFKVDGLTAGARYRFLVRALTDRQNGQFISGSSAQVEATLNNPAQGVPMITGTVRVGRTLTADTSGITDGDGLPPAFTYQWFRVAGGMETGISGATSKTYTLVADDVDETIRVKVGFIDNAGFSESLSSALTTAARAAPSGPPQGVAAIPGNGFVTLSWRPPTNNGGAPVVRYFIEYGLHSPDSPFLSYSQIVGTATVGGADRSFRVDGLTAGARYRFLVRALTDRPNGKSIIGSPVQVEATLNNPAQGVPMITGTVRIGQTLTADTSGITDVDGLPPAFTYQWFWVYGHVADGPETEISGAISMTYTPVAADQGQSIRVKVGFTDNAGFSESLRSALTTPPMPSATTPGPPKGLVAVSRDKGLTLNWLPPALNGGPPIFSYKVSYTGATGPQWHWRRQVDYNIASQSFSFSDLLNGVSYEFSVRAANTNAEKGPEAIVRGTPGANNPARGVLVIDGAARVGQTLTVRAKGGGVTDADGIDGGLSSDGLPASSLYQWWRQVDGGTETKIPGAVLKTYTPVAADVGKTLRVEIEFVDHKGVLESLKSAPTTRVLPRVYIAPVNASVTEGDNAVFRITRPNTPNLPAEGIRVDLDYHDKIFAADARPNKTQRLTFARGQTEITLTLHTNNDQRNLGDGMIRAAINPAGSSQKTWIRVRDDDVPVVTLSTNKQSITEGETFKWILKRSCCITSDLGLYGSAHGASYWPSHRGGDREFIPLSDYRDTFNVAGYIPSGNTQKEFPDQGPGIASSNAGLDVVGPLGGYIQRRIRPPPTVPVEGIPAWNHATFQPDRYTVTSSDWVRVDIHNSAPVVEIETRHDSVTEGDDIQFTIRRYGGAPNIIKQYGSSVRVRVEQNGHWLASPEVAGSVWQIDLSRGETLLEVSVSTINDSVEEDNGEVTVTILPGADTARTEDAYEFYTEYIDVQKRYPHKISVVVRDDDRGATVSPPTLTIAEGGIGVYTVVLASAPIGDVTITPSSDNPDVTLSESTLTFTSNDWEHVQTVTVMAAEDPDANNDSARVTHTVTGGGYSSAPAVTVTVTDDDEAGVTLSESTLPVAGVTVSPTTLTVTEEDATGTDYTVALATRPTHAVTVALSSDNADVTLSESTLSFTRENWYSAQTVTVKAAADNDATDDSATVTHTAAGGDYAGLMATVAVTVTDDDEAGVTVTPKMLTIDEGATGTYEVVLTSAPTDDVTITLSSDNPDVTPSDALAFTDANWDSAQTVTVTAAEDNDAANDSATITHMVTGGDYGSEGVTATDVVVTVTDDETRGVTVTPTTLDIDEGATGTYEVVLTSAPTEEVTVTLSSDNPDVTPSDALAFTDANWDSAQTVTVTAAEDNDAANDSATITHMVTGGDYGSEGVTATDVVVTVTDDETRGVTVTPTTLDIDEGATGTYEVVLTSAPTDEVTVTLSSDNPDVTPSDALAFTDANWDSAQTVTVTAAEDNDAANDSATITHMVTGGDYGSEGVTATDVVVTVTDDETRGVTVTPTTLDIDEGATGTYEVVLTSAPTEEVTVTLSSDNPDVTPSDALAFTDANWDSAQTVTVTAAEDNDAANDSATITHMVTGGDYGKAGVTATDVVVTVTDDDDAGVTVTPTTLDIDEGATGTYEVVLTSAPTEEVTVTLSSDNPDVTPSDALAFTDANWDSAQTVTVTAAEDNDAANDSATITHMVTGGDYGKAGVTATDVVVTVTDDETRGVTVTPTTLDIDEGATGTYEVVLTSAPTEEVTVTLSSDNPDVTPSESTLSFTRDDWNNAQTVTVKAAADNDATDENVTITHTAASGDYEGLMATVAVTVTDDDDAGVTVTPTTLSVAEDDATGTDYTVALATRPTHAVTVALSSDNADVTLSESTLSFTRDDWNNAQTVTVKAAADNDATDENVTITHTAASGDYEGLMATVAVTVTDDDDAGVTVTPTTLSVAEDDATGTDYTVALATRPTHAVTVALSSDNADVTLSESTLSFTRDDWNNAQTVTVKAAADNDATDENVTITHTAASGDYEGLMATVAVTVTDDDDAGVTVTPTTLSVAEDDATGTDYTVALATRPTHAVTVALSSDNADVTLSESTLSFTRDDWNNAQTVTVKAAADNDATDENVTITHTAASGDYEGLMATVAVTVTDDDDAGVTVTPTTLSVAEDDATGTDYTVALATRPTHAVTVALSSDNADVTLSESTLSFTRDDWNNAQTVTVKAAADNDATDENVTITHTAASGDYEGLMATVAVTVTDDDDAGVTVTPTTLSVAEDDATGTDYTVALATRPTHAVTVALSSDNADVTLSESTLSFTRDDWNNAQTVTVKAAADNDATDENVTITHTAASGDYEGLMATVAVTVTDDDDAGVTVTPTTLSVAEDDATGTDYTVALATRPTHAVTVALSSDNADVTLSESTLSFTRDDWNNAQTVTVKAAADNDATDENVTITHTAASGDYEGLMATVAVTVTDDDDAGVTVTPTTLSVAEDDATGTDYTVALATRPTHAVTVALSSDNADVTLSESTLSFTRDDWNNAQTVTVKAAADNDATDENVTITHTAASGDYEGLMATVAVTVTDDDDAGVTVTPTTLSVAEDDATGTDYTVALATRPTHAVTVALSSDNADVTLSESTLSFTRDDWNNAQTVTVKAAADNDATDENVTITHTAASGDYEGLMATVAVTVTDDDDAGVTVTPTTLSVAEDDATGTDYTVALATRPTHAVTVALSSDNADVTLSESTLSFTRDDWNNAQTVTVKAAADNDATDENVTITHTAASGDYEGLMATVAVTVTDDDDAGVTVTPTTLSVAEDGATGTDYTVALATRPTHAVTVALSSDNADVTLSESTLSFTRDDWNNAQTVTVKAAADNDATDENVTITHTAASGDYEGLMATVAVTVTDDDDAGVTVTPTTLSVAEDDATGTDYTVALATRPTHAVTVALSSDNADVTLSESTLSFTRDDWNNAQTVTVKAAADNDATDENVTITHTAASGDYEGLMATVAVTVTDDDDAGVTVTPTTLSVAEDDATGTDYTVALATRPTHAVTVALSSDNADVTLSESTLSFTRDDWNNAQTVTVKAAADNDATDENVTITHTAASGDYEGLMATVAVTVTDDDDAGVTVTPTTLSVAEDDATGTDYTVALATRPTHAVTVALSSDNADVTLSESTLSFTRDDWNNAQTVTVKAAADNDATDENVTITHTAASGDYEGLMATVAVTVTDDDDAGVTVTPTTLSVAEDDATGTDYTVALATRPTHAVTVALSSDNADVTLSESTLSFTRDDWNNAQTVTVKAAADNDATDENVTITHTAASGDYEGLMATVAVTVTDDDDAGVTVTPTTLSVAEDDATGTDYTVALATRPTHAVTVALSSDNADVTLSESTLSFTRDDWNNAQTVTVKAAADNDATDENVTITHTAASGDYEGLMATVAVTVTDDDDAGVTVTPTTLSVAEDDATGTDYTVALATRPTHAVTVALSSDNADVTLSESTLSFTRDDWNNAQTVTVKAAADNDATDENVTITHTAASGDYEGLMATVAVTVTDDDDAGVTVTPTTLSVAEDDATGTDYTVALATRPTHAVTVALSSDNADVTLSESTLSFTRDDWNNAQTVTVKAAADNDATDENVTITHTAASGDYEGLMATVAVTVTDDDDAGVTVTPTTLSVAEDDATGTDYTVALATRPTHAVTVALSSDNADVTLSESTLSFTRDDWNNAQTVTVKAAADNDATDENVTITHTAASGDYEGLMATVAVTVTDDDDAGVTVTPTTLSVAEDDATGTDYTVALATRPTHAVTVALSSDNADVTLSESTLSFTRDDWNNAQTVTVKAAADNDATDENVTITHTAASGDYEGLMATVAVTVTDDDDAGVTVTPTTLSVAEDDATGTDYTVALATRPTHAVTVALSSDNADVTLSESTLSFTRDDWNNAQTVTVKAAADNDATDENVTITHTAASGDYEGLMATVAVTVTDDDDAGVTVTPTTLSVAEDDATGTDYTVALATRPTHAVTVALSSDNADVTLSESTLSFTRDDWNNAQTVTVKAAADNDATDENVTITHTAASGDYEGLMATVAVTVTDDDDAGVTVTPTTLSVAEDDATGTDYTVALATRPTHAVTVALSSDNADVTLSESTLSFTRDDWNNAQTVTVKAAADNDATDENVTITHTAASGDYEGLMATVAVTVTDDDDAGVTVTPTTLSVAEDDATGTDYTVALATRPTHAVTVALSSDNADVTLSESTLSFTRDDWNNAQTVTVKAAADNDATDENVTITHTAASGDYEGLMATVAVTVTDDDDAGVTVTPTTLSVAEDDATGTDYTVALATRPTHAVTVALSSDNADVTLSESTLSFTRDDWNNAQTVTVKAAADNDATDENVTITHTAASGDYEGLMATVAVTVTDDDDAGVTVTPTTLSVAEDDATGTDYTVALATRPTHAVTVALSSDNADVTLSESTLSFTRDDWNNAQTVTVKAAADNDATDENVTITHTAASGDYEGLMATVAVTVTDDDDAGVTVTPTTLSVAEDDATGTDYTVALATRPTHAVTVALSSDNADVTLSESTLSFTRDDWNNAQTVTVKAAADNDATDENVTITHTAASGDYEGLMATVAVTVTDDDDAGVTVTPTTLSVAEDDATGTDYTVALATRPTHAVTVALSSDNADVTLSESTLSFTRDDWNNAQTVTVKAAADNDATDENVTITHTAASGDYEGLMATVAVTVTDDDDAGVTVTPTTLSVAEDDATGTDYTVALATRPTHAVTVALSSDNADVTLSESTLSFTRDDWNNAQTVTVKAAADNDATDENVTITHTAASGDYEGLMATVAVTVTDDDDAGVTVTPTTLSVAEDDATGTDYTVALATRPTHAVTVALSSDNADVTLSESTLSFTRDDWNNAQTVTVKAAADNDATDENVTITHTAASGDYEGLMATVAVTVTDDDDAGVTVTPTTLSVAEDDATGTDYTVALATRPTHAVTVALSSDNADVTLSESTLSFTRDDWNNAQTVTVKAAADNDATDENVTITHTAASGDYEGLMATVAVTVTDDDDAGVTVTPTTLSVAEDDATGTDYTVALATRPTHAVTVALSSDNADVTLSESTLSFTRDDWNNAQTVTVKAAADNDATDENVTITHTAASGDYEGLMATVAVTVTDDDDAGVTVTPTTLSVAEDDATGTDYTVALATRPTHAVTVALSSDNADVTLSESTLSFTRDDWNNAQTVTVKAAADNDATDENVTITHTAASGDYEGLMATVAVTVTDDDDAGVTVTPTTLSVAEDDATGTDYTVALATRPTHAVTVALSSDNADVTLSESTLSFTRDDWNNAQTVTVKAAADNDATDENVTITHTAASGDYEGLMATVAVTVTDDDDAGVTVTPTTLSVAEDDATGTDYTVALATRPTHAVTVALSSDNADVTLSESTLSFTRDDWNNAQTVTVKAAADNDATDENVTITHTAASGDYEGLMATVAVTVTDDDDAGVTVTPTTLSVAEDDATGTDYTVALATRPTHAVTVALSSDNADVTLSESTLSFTRDDWNNAQTVTVKAAADNDATDENVTITHTAASGDYEGLMATVAVTVTDDDDAGVTVTPTTLSVAEDDATGTDYTVALATRPTHAVTVALSSDNADVTLSESTLSFTRDDWNNAQTVTVKAAADNDATDENVTITHTAASGDYEGLMATVAVTVTDDDDAGVTVTPTTLSVAEDDATGTDYTVALATRPTHAVTVALSSDNADVTLSESTLSFTRDDWNNAQTVTVKAAADNDATDENVTITHTAASGDYEGLMATVAVTVTDDDAAGVTVSQPKLTVTEEDAAGTDYTVALATRPTHGVTVALSSDNADVTVSQSTLSFTRDDWNRGQTVTVKAAADSDATDENVTITHTAAGGDYAGRTATVAVTVTDDDEDSTQVALSVDPQRVGESAGATTVTVTATLNGGARDSAVQLTVTVGSGTATAGVDFTAVDDVPLTVRAGDRSGSQIFTLTPTVDTTDEEDETVAVSATTTASGLSVSGTEITITDTEIMIINDDSLGVIVKPTTLTLTEGATGAYTVVLTSAPTGGEVTITPSSNNPKVECRPVALTFTRADWNTAQTFLVTAYEDQDAAADSATVTHTVAGGDYGSGGVTAAAVAVTVTDNDDVSTQVALSVKPNPVGESAGDTTVTVTATLNGGTRDDAVPLMVTVDSGSATSGVDFTRVQDVALMIDAGERSGSGTFTLTPTADDTDEADETVKVSATTTAVGLLVSDTEITITDDDAEPKVTLALDPASIREGAGEITTVTATLDRASSEETTVTVSASPVAPAVLGDYTRSGETLTIAAGATSSTGAVTLTGVDNEVDAADKTVTVSATVENSLGAVAVAEQTLTITDEDVRGVAVSSNMLTIAEGATGTYTVVLTSAPTEEVTITLSSDNPDVTLSDALAFTDANWNNAQMVTVAAAEDNDANNDSATITHTLTGGDYEKAGVTAAAVAVTVTDNDTVGRTLPAWLARFGRTVTDQVLDAVTDRMAAPRSPGMEVSLAGRVLPVGSQESAEREYGLAEDSPAGHAAHDYAAAGGLRASLAERGAMDALRNWISHTGAEGDDVPDGAPGAGSLGLQSWSPTGRDFVSGTSFSLTGEPRADGGLLSVWGRGALTNFAGRDGDLALDGEVQTLLVGAERSWRGWTTGGILGRSRAEGGYRSAAETGEIEATLTGVYPWVARAVNDHVSAWAAVGYGAGDLTLKPEGGGRIRTPLSLALGAAGLRGEVLRPLEAGGLSLAVKGDVRFTRAASKAAGDTMVGRLMAAEADVWRVRAGVEGARSFMANDDAWATITPSFEVGVRLDGGDAETGFGADVGGGVALVDPGRGVTLEMKARGLAAHEAEGFREWGASAALVWEPRPQSERGLSLSLTQSWGASSSGGMDALLSRDTLVGLAASDTAPAGRRLEAELGYGMAVFGGDFTGAPNAALTVTEDGRDWRLGWRLTPAWPDGSGFEVNLDVLRREADGEAPAHAVMLRGAIRF